MSVVPALGLGHETGEGGEELTGEGVAGLGPIEGDGGDSVRHIEQGDLGHGDLQGDGSVEGDGRGPDAPKAARSGYGDI
jgi:hypothetical protein